MAIITYPNIIYPVAREERLVATGNKRDINRPSSTNAGPSPKSNSTHTQSRERTEFGWKGTYENYPDGGFPILASGSGLYTTIDPGRDIYPWMHQQMEISNTILTAKFNGNVTFAIPRDAHVTSDENYNGYSEGKNPVIPYPLEYYPGTHNDGDPYPFARFNLPYRQNAVFQYRGSTTHLNPENDPDKQKIMDEGLDIYDKDNVKMFKNGSDEYNASPGSPTSPLHPFMRTYADRAHQAIVSAYNRTRIPIADIEHRKAFRYIFITRPECYLMTTNGKLCYQAEMDDDFNTCWNRMPHVVYSLSPVYVVPSIGEPKHANWNYLLSNRVMSMNTIGTTLSVVDSMTKGVRGATVIPGKQITSNLNNTMELTFRDTKYMDVYESLRMWILYIHKRKSGEFFPPYNGYEYVNNFRGPGAISTQGGSRLHPYDRAMEYGATIFDIITNETGSKILYWCKYYGVFPISVNTSMLTQQNAGALLGESTVSAQFQYQYKQENAYKSLVEFNYNGGLFDNMGKAYVTLKDIIDDVPFLYRENGHGGSDTTSAALKNYIGAAGLITGAPYIISEISGTHNAWDWNGETPIASFLKFMPASTIDGDLNASMNMGITSRGPKPGEVMNYNGPVQHATSSHSSTPITSTSSNTSVYGANVIPPKPSTSHLTNQTVTSSGTVTTTPRVNEPVTIVGGSYSDGAGTINGQSVQRYSSTTTTTTATSTGSSPVINPQVVHLIDEKSVTTATRTTTVVVP